MERLQKSMTAYVKSLSKRNEGEDKEKILPVAFMGSTMVNHGEDFENESEFGQCLIGMDVAFALYDVRLQACRHGSSKRAHCTDTRDIRH